MYINKAFELVKWTQGQTGTNPAVGCLIVKDDRIVGIGAHLIQGEAHAEINAIQMAGKHAQGATLYCTLEPCSHFGKTPPCMHKIVEVGIKKVVFAVKDQSLHSSVDYMTSNGVEVEQVNVTEIDAFYAPFFKAKRTKMPYTIIKMGVTLDGKTADDYNVSKWITNVASREDVHQERYLCDGIMVGYETYKQDQPKLDARLYKQKNIKKIIITSGIFFINESDLLEKDRLIVISKIPQQVEGVKVLVIPDLAPKKILSTLYEHHIHRLMIEGGMSTIRKFILNHAYDEIHQYIAPKLLGGTSKHRFLTTENPSLMSNMTPLQLVSVTTFDNDVKLVYRKEA